MNGSVELNEYLPSLPRVCERQCHSSNVPAQTPSEYYRRNLSIPVLDHLLSELETRFSTGPLLNTLQKTDNDIDLHCSIVISFVKNTLIQPE